MQTNLESDNFCGYNQEAAPFFWVLQPASSQGYNNMYAIGEVGVPAQGGSAGSYVRPEIIDIASFLDGRDNILSKCNPPVPSLDSLNREEPMSQQNKNASILLQKYTKEKKSAVALDSIDYNRFDPGLKVDPQNLRFVIEDFSNTRGGMDTKNYVKSSWSNQNNVPNFDRSLCQTVLDPSRACGPYCEDITGYNKVAVVPGKPPGQAAYPFVDITSQQIYQTGAEPCGPQFFFGQHFDQGSCPPIDQDVLAGRYQ
jgi:hypothetical protein